MDVVFDIEANGLTPDTVWCIVCEDLETGDQYEFLPFKDGFQGFLGFARRVSNWYGHNCIGYDCPNLNRLAGDDGVFDWGSPGVIDTLVVSRLINYRREGGHGLESYGQEFDIPKIPFDAWDHWDPLILERCKRDVAINSKLVRHLHRYLSSERWQPAICTEHFLAWVCHDMHRNGFPFARDRARELHSRISQELSELDEKLLAAFPPKVRFIKEITPRETKHGTINRSDLRWAGDDLTPYSVGASFSRIEFVPFNPGSPSQIVERLNEAGWKPTEKTKGHKEAEKELRELSFRKRRVGAGDANRRRVLQEKLEQYKITGWKISETNLDTLPDTAPEAAKLLALRLKLASRRSTLETWLSAYNEETGCVHGEFWPIGSWTHRMAHTNPNMGNPPKFNPEEPEKTKYADEMRSCWTAGEDEYLVGVDAEGIQMRIFAHYAEDEELIHALIAGKKEDGSDPHSVNKRALGDPCKSRDAAKTYYYAWVLGVGVEKGAEILECSPAESKEANENFVNKYPGIKHIKKHVIPEDAARGYFQGLDGRYVWIYGDTEDERRHFAFAGYLQNGEKIIMARALQIWYPKLQRFPGFRIRNFVHDEYQFTIRRDFDLAVESAKIVADAIREAGESLALRCPMAGSFLATLPGPDGKKRLAIGDNWLETH